MAFQFMFCLEDSKNRSVCYDYWDFLTNFSTYFLTTTIWRFTKLQLICQRTQSKNQTRATWVCWCQQHCFRENEDWHVIYFLAPHAWRKYYLNCIMFFSMDRPVSKCKTPNEMSYNVFCCVFKLWWRQKLWQTFGV